MEFFQTNEFYIILDQEFSLWCDRTNGNFEPRKGSDFQKSKNPICIGKIYGLIGKVKLHPDSEWRLLVIKQRSLVCKLAGQFNIYKIDKIAVLPINTVDSAFDILDLEPCGKEQHSHHKTSQANDASQQMSLRGTWNSIKTAAENVKLKKKETKDKEKFEKRILEELMKMYNGSDFFYYSDNFDVTNCLQRQYKPTYDRGLALWKRADERFFWNKHMLLDLMATNDPLADHWMVPVIQGFVQMEKCVMDFDEDKKLGSDVSSSVDFPSRRLEPLGYNISIISRRSRHRAGTRSRARGINASGACANYVETEQIIEFSPHLVSFVQVRGSIPVFWSQSGFKYRPPPRLDKDEAESHKAFVAHVSEQLDIYQKLAVVSLAELAGKEQILGDAYMSHVIELNSPDVTYITFDFHEYCRGMRFENVSILTNGIKDIIKDMRYCWVDDKGLIYEQQGVFRVNCVDCLDRTNVVQTAIARIVMETQFRKLGLLPPEENLPVSCRMTYQQIWANNGDVISQQYAGTAALKGDFTRTGERKLTGLMKDGVNSANRYYLRFRDAYRQAAIDLTLGQPVSESLMVPSVEGDDTDGSEASEKEENVKMILEDCKRMLIVEPEQCIGGWALVNADPIEGDSDQQDMDIVLLLSQRSVYVAWYDDEAEQVTKYQRIFLEDVEKIEIGMEPAVFKSKFPCLRLIYHYQADEGLYHMFRLPHTRLFNNKATVVMSQEEAKDSLRMIADTFKSAQDIMKIELEIVEKPKLEKRKATAHPDVVDVFRQQQENSLAGISLPRDISADISSALQAADNHSVSRLEPGPSTVSPVPRSVSPLEFLNNFSKQNMSKNMTAKFTLPKPNLKINLQNLNLMRRIKLNKDNENSDDCDSNCDSEDERNRQEATQDVVLDSCGILASSPNQILLSSIHLKAESRRSMPQVDSLTHTPPKVFSFEKLEADLNSTATQTGVSKQNIPDTDHVDANSCGGFASQSTTKTETSTEKPEDDDSSEGEYCVIENDEVRAILGKCHQLHHPHMKTSLSDTTLSASLNSAPQDTMVLAQSNLDPRDAGLVSRFKQKMVTLSKTSAVKFIEPAFPRVAIRKSQRVLGVFEKLKKEKIPPNVECQTHFIFI
ncbi:phosphatidylinositide phosphatase SAC2-like [Physella acuta]|uniref:phosphatidylinositide phosphatase SAC2-like n=1 Tax=Physella acuta TaxID=109671 RepID=UPI0027DB521A|nr:phosphatidylinositide phosphatase SAC2-like [Physella acuta]